MKRKTRKLIAVTKSELDQVECDCGSHEPITYFGPACHKGAPVEVSYERGSGEIRLGCIECEKVFMKIAVADPISRS